MHILAFGQYRVLSWEGDVRVKQGGMFIRLAERSEIILKKGDSLWVEGRASIRLLFPDGTNQEFNGPYFTRVEALVKNKTRARSSFLANFIKITRIPELFSREKEDAAGTTKGDDFKSSSSFYKGIKKAIEQEFAGVKDSPPAADKKKEMTEGLAVVKNNFDAASLEKQAIMKARIYKHFNQGKQAFMVVFNHYKKILNVGGKQIERELLEESIFNEFLPVVITFKADGPEKSLVKELEIIPKVSISFSANFKLWWAAFYYDGNGFEEIEKTIDTRLHPQDTFKIEHDRDKEKDKSLDVFIIACSDWSQLEKYDDMEEVKKELLGREIPAASSGKAVGIGKVIVKIGLKNKNEKN
jgi:hypothetical protein